MGPKPCIFLFATILCMLHEFPVSYSYEILKCVSLFREKEIRSIPAIDERKHNLLALYQSTAVPVFSGSGISILGTPKHLHTALNDIFESAHKATLGQIPVITNSVLNVTGVLMSGKIGSHTHGKNKPQTLQLPRVMKDYLLTMLKPVHEQWAGVNLEAVNIVGPRLFSVGSSIPMQLHKVDAGMISSYIRLSSCRNLSNLQCDDWTTHAISSDGLLDSFSIGNKQMLLIEGSRILHGRLRPLAGSEEHWYIDMLLQYQPKNYSLAELQFNESSLHRDWQIGAIEDKGSRFLGPGQQLSLTIDSLAAANSPPRVCRGRYLHSTVSPFARHNNNRQDAKYSNGLRALFSGVC